MEWLFLIKRRINVIGDYEPEQFNMQLSLLDDSPERISRNELIERIESEL